MSTDDVLFCKGGRTATMKNGVSSATCDEYSIKGPPTLPLAMPLDQKKGGCRIFCFFMTSHLQFSEENDDDEFCKKR